MNRCRFIFPLLLLLLALFPIAVGAATANDESFEAANRLFAQGQFTNAAAHYEQLIERGVISSAVYFNLANARFKSGDTGRAVIALRQAQLLAPRDPDIRANLEFIRGQVQGPRNEPSWIQRAFVRLTLNEWTILFAAALWMFLLSLAAGLIKPAWSVISRRLAWISAAATVFAGICLGAAWSLHATPLAVVTTEEAQVRTGPFEESASAFAVHNGAELKILDEKDGWFRVQAGSRTGWLKASQAGRWRPI